MKFIVQLITKTGVAYEYDLAKSGERKCSRIINRTVLKTSYPVGALTLLDKSRSAACQKL